MGLALAASTLVLTAPTALAGDSAPSCVSWSDRIAYYNITNNCKKTKRLKVVIAWGPDSDCQTYRPGQTRKVVTGVVGALEKIELC